MLNKSCLFLIACLVSMQAPASVRDDAGNTVTLPQPAQRIISLAPHVAELLFAAGAGDRIVGTVSYSDYPAQARAIPRIGDMRQIDIERLAALKPDLLVVWPHNESSRQLEQLRALGIPMFYSDPRKLDDIPDTLLRLGQLLGTEQKARQIATELRRQLNDLVAHYHNRPTIRVFYQVWGRPLYTLNGGSIVSDAIRVCGGENIFARLPVPAPQVSIEAVLQENPEAVISGDSADRTSSGVDLWKRYPTLLAARRGNLFSLDADLLNRPGPRIIAGTAALCEMLDEVRKHRAARP